MQVPSWADDQKAPQALLAKYRAILEKRGVSVKNSDDNGGYYDREKAPWE